MPKKLSIEEFREIAVNNGGVCLSKKYRNSHTKLKFKCANNHVWEATPAHIKHSKSWCLVCSGKSQYTIEQMHELAKKKGGKCLSSSYKNISSQLKWQCEEGHIWTVSPISNGYTLHYTS